MTVATRAQVERLAALGSPADRRRAGAFLIEGERLLAEALAAGCAPELVALDERGVDAAGDLLERARAAGAAIVQLSERAARRLSDRENARGLLAIVPLPAPWDGALPTRGRALLVALCGVQDPGNVGTLLRSAAAFGAHAALLTPGCADAFGPKVVRAAAGSVLRLPLAHPSVDELAGLAARHALQLVAAQTPGAPGEEALGALPARCLLLLGHETRGAPRLPGARTVCIAHEPQVESLNVAMAGSILLADWYRSGT